VCVRRCILGKLPLSLADFDHHLWLAIGHE